MNDELQVTIVAFCNEAVAGLDRSERKIPALGNLRVIRNPNFELRMLVDALEAQPIFGKLVKQTKATFRTDDLEIEGWWEHRVKNFFRRSGFYSGAYQGEALESQELVRAYISAFERREIERTYLAPIEYVSFDTDKLEFGSFEIRRFSAEEIDSTFWNDINHVFFEPAVADARILDDYWFLRVVEQIPITDPLSTPLPGPEVMHRYTPFPSAFETVLQQLALYDWRYWGFELYGDDEPEKGWFSFNIPFVLVLDDDLLGDPRGIPDLSILRTEPHIVDVNGREIDSERPARGIEMTEEKEAAFKEFMMRVGSLLEVVRAHQRWPFLVLALKLLAKAFITDGPEQLLWHITALESLLGENKRGNTNRLARRIGSILGADAAAKGALDSRFRELYGFRCKLVHGNQPDTVLFRRHLREARELARQTVLWFLHYLKQLPESDLPTRRELLRRIDLETS